MSTQTSQGLRVQKIIADAGLASRREAEEWIELGDVTINGRVAKLGDKAVPGVDHIKVNGKLMHFGQKRVVIAFYKPRGVLSHKIADEKDERRHFEGGTVFEYLHGVRERVFPVGQLDKDAEGLLLLTNDGELAQRLNQERYEIPKIYKVKIDGHLDDSRVKRLSGRFKVEEKVLKLLDIRPLKELEGKQWIRVKITNTQNRVIRKMFEAVGRPVDKVRRMSFAGVSINGLERGEFRYLGGEEIRELYKSVGLGIESKPRKEF
jgi:23S rRNA pseudouridine2605 synthase